MVGVVHVVQLEVRVPFEQHPAGLEPPPGRGRGIVDVDAAVPDGNQERLREPGSAEGGAEVDERAVRGADEDERIAAEGMLARHPLRHRLCPHGVKRSRRDRLRPAAPDVDLLPARVRECVEKRRQRPQRPHRQQTQARIIAAGQEARQGPQRRRRRIEAGRSSSRRARPARAPRPRSRRRERRRARRVPAGAAASRYRRSREGPARSSGGTARAGRASARSRYWRHQRRGRTPRAGRVRARPT